MEKELKLKMIGYRINGTTKLKDWYGNIGYIEMEDVTFNHLPTDVEILENLNDNGFGCEKILGGKVSLYELYEDEHKVLLKREFIGSFTEEDEIQIE